jgi:hypothetical protein
MLSLMSICSSILYIFIIFDKWENMCVVGIVLTKQCVKIDRSLCMKTLNEKIKSRNKNVHKYNQKSQKGVGPQ